MQQITTTHVTVVEYSPDWSLIVPILVGVALLGGLLLLVGLLRKRPPKRPGST